MCAPLNIFFYNKYIYHQSQCPLDGNKKRSQWNYNKNIKLKRKNEDDVLSVAFDIFE